MTQKTIKKMNSHTKKAEMENIGLMCFPLRGKFAFEQNVSVPKEWWMKEASSWNQAAGANGQQREIVVLILRELRKRTWNIVIWNPSLLSCAFYTHSNYLETLEVRAVVSSSILLSP